MAKQEIRWFLICLMVLVTAIVGNVAYFGDGVVGQVWGISLGVCLANFVIILIAVFSKNND